MLGTLVCLARDGETVRRELVLRVPRVVIDAFLPFLAAGVAFVGFRGTRGLVMISSLDLPCFSCSIAASLNIGECAICEKEEGTRRGGGVGSAPCTAGVP